MCRGVPQRRHEQQIDLGRARELGSAAKAAQLGIESLRQLVCASLHSPGRLADLKCLCLSCGQWDNVRSQALPP